MFAGVLLYIVKAEFPVNRHIIFLPRLKRDFAKVNYLSLSVKKSVGHLRVCDGSPVSGLASALGEKQGTVGGYGKSAVGLFARYHPAFPNQQKGIVFIKLLGHLHPPNIGPQDS